MKAVFLSVHKRSPSSRLESTRLGICMILKGISLAVIVSYRWNLFERNQYICIFKVIFSKCGINRVIRDFVVVVSVFSWWI